MISEISLKNARAFKKLHIPLKPLTVLLGPNSAGKSTAGQLLAAMAHAHRTQQRFSKPTLTPEPREVLDWPVNLGSFDDLRTEGEKGRVEIGLHTADGWVNFGFGLEGVPDLRFSYLSHPVAPSQSTQAQELASATVPAGRQTPVVDSPADASVQASIMPGLQAATIELTRRANNEIDWFERDSQVYPLFDGLVLAGVQRSAMSAGVAPKAGAKQDLESFLTHLTYLRAGRERPFRRYELSLKSGQKIGYSGEFTASVLFQHGGDERDFPNVTQGPDATLRFGASRTSLNAAVAHWMQWLGLASDVAVMQVQDNELEIRVCLRKGEAARNLTEVGFAISQLLPVLVAGLLQRTGSILEVDLPEAHLHPAVQARLADFFIALALGGVQTLLETHSELLFHRLRWLVAMRPDLEEHCEVIFLDAHHADDAREPRVIGLRAECDVEWPVGFMNEQWDLETQILRFRGELKARKA